MSSTDEAMRLLRGLFDGALERVHRQAAAMSLDAALLSTTLCVGVADANRAAFAQVGDGIIATERGDDAIETLLIEHKDGYANTTSFLQSDGALQDSLRATAQDGVTAFALSTDGLSYKITDVATGAAYQPFFRGSWQHLRSGARSDQLHDMLAGIEDDQTGDDKTLVLAARCDHADRAVAETMRWSHSASPGNPDVVSETGTAGESAVVAVTDSGPDRSRNRWGRWLR